MIMTRLVLCLIAIHSFTSIAEKKESSLKEESYYFLTFAKTIKKIELLKKDGKISSKEAEKAKASLVCFCNKPKPNSSYIKKTLTFFSVGTSLFSLNLLAKASWGFSALTSNHLTERIPGACHLLPDYSFYHCVETLSMSLFTGCILLGGSGTALSCFLSHKIWTNLNYAINDTMFSLKVLPNKKLKIDTFWLVPKKVFRSNGGKLNKYSQRV